MNITKQLNQANPNWRDVLRDVYADWRNNYLTVDRFAECNGLTPMQATKLIALAQDVFRSPHPEE